MESKKLITGLIFVCADKITQETVETVETKEDKKLNPLSRFLKWMDK